MEYKKSLVGAKIKTNSDTFIILEDSHPELEYGWMVALSERYGIKYSGYRCVFLDGATDVKES